MSAANQTSGSRDVARASIGFPILLRAYDDAGRPYGDGDGALRLWLGTCAWAQDRLRQEGRAFTLTALFDRAARAAHEMLVQ